MRNIKEQDLKEHFKLFLIEACKTIGNSPSYSRLWTQITRNSDNNTSYDQNLIPDIDRMVPNLAFSMLLNSPEFNNLIKAADGYKPLFDYIETTFRFSDRKLKSITQFNSIFLWNAFVGKFLYAYFSKSFQKNKNLKFNESLFDSIFDKFTNDLQSKKVKIIKIMPVIGNVNLSMDEFPITSDLSLRKIKDNEISQWFNTSSVFNSPTLPNDRFGDLQFAIESSSTYDPTQNTGPEINNEDEYLLSNLIGLIMNNEVIIVLIDRVVDSVVQHGFRGITWSNSFHPFTLSPKSIINETEAKKIQDYWQKLKGHPDSDKIKMALRRWLTAYQRLQGEDAIIDYWIALESLFLTDGNQELGFKASLRIAEFIGSEIEDKIIKKDDIFENMKDSYNIRSKVVHGSFKKNGKDLEKLRKFTKLTRDYLRLAILKIIDTNTKFDPACIDIELLG